MNDANENSGHVLVVDDSPTNRELVRRLLEGNGYVVETATDGESALASIRREAPDVILLDVIMPGLSGFEVCHRVKQDPTTRLIPVVLLTGLSEQQDRIAGIDAGADDFLSKPFDPSELTARVRSLIRMKRYTDDLDSAEAVVLSLARTIEAQDKCTKGHCERLAYYATTLGTHVGLGAEEIEALQRGGVLHDLGKIGVPDSVLLKGGPLTPDERAIIEQHPAIGDTLCGQLRALQRVRPIVRHHHERLDGSGYPDGLRGDAIPLLAQIISIADIYDALTTDRPYRQALSRERAFDELKAEVRRGWRRADLVQEFIKLSAAEQLELPEEAAASKP